LIDNYYRARDSSKITGGAFGIKPKAEREKTQLFEPDSVCTDGGIVKLNTQTRYAFSISDVCYQDKVVLAAQEITLPIGQWTCLIGKSGKGKTTLLKTLLGLVPGLGSYGSKVTMSYMSQNDLLLPWKTILENVALGNCLRQQPLKLQQAQRLLGGVGLKDEINHYPHQLSVGMRQRVALARTLMEKAELVLMDEPFSAVDLKIRQELHALTKTLLKGKTVLFVSHDLQEISALADQIIVLKGQPAICKFLPLKQEITFLYQALYA
jgi:putative hydroxymethylpyrimidine transport system ATP-binding protein